MAMAIHWWGHPARILPQLKKNLRRFTIKAFRRDVDERPRLRDLKTGCPVRGSSAMGLNQARAMPDLANPDSSGAQFRPLRGWGTVHCTGTPGDLRSCALAIPTQMVAHQPETTGWTDHG
jgi:hypothetical protein